MGLLRRATIDSLLDMLGFHKVPGVAGRIEHLAEEVKVSSKPWWQSVGIWSSIVTIVAALARARGWEIQTEGLDEQLASIVGLGIPLVAGIGSLYGRLRASHTITVAGRSLAPPPEV